MSNISRAESPRATTPPICSASSLLSLRGDRAGERGLRLHLGHRRRPVGPFAPRGAGLLGRLAGCQLSFHPRGDPVSPRPPGAGCPTIGFLPASTVLLLGT